MGSEMNRICSHASNFRLALTRRVCHCGKKFSIKKNCRFLPTRIHSPAAPTAKKFSAVFFLFIWFIQQLVHKSTHFLPTVLLGARHDNDTMVLGYAETHQFDNLLCEAEREFCVRMKWRKKTPKNCTRHLCAHEKNVLEPRVRGAVP